MVNNVEELSASGLITGITLAVVVVLVLIIVIIYYKRRVERLKFENRAVVHYIPSTEGTDAGDYTNISITNINESVVCVIIDSLQKKIKENQL